MENADQIGVEEVFKAFVYGCVERHVMLQLTCFLLILLETLQHSLNVAAFCDAILWSVLQAMNIAWLGSERPFSLQVVAWIVKRGSSNLSMDFPKLHKLPGKTAKDMCGTFGVVRSSRYMTLSAAKSSATSFEILLMTS